VSTPHRAENFSADDAMFRSVIRTTYPLEKSSTLFSFPFTYKSLKPNFTIFDPEIRPKSLYYNFLVKKARQMITLKSDIIHFF
jgi:hypothetical protein